MKIIQIIGNLSYGDGMGNCVLSISKILDELNIKNDIITFSLDNKIQKENIYLFNIYETITADEDDIIMYHFGIGASLNYIIENLPYKKILVYQNVTTPDFFRGINDDLMKDCLWGLYDASKTAGKYLRSIVPSEYSKKNLLEMGWKAEEISVLPLIKTNDLTVEPNEKIVERYSDECVNILFTGRIAPNKKIEDIIKIFSNYQKNINVKSRLILVGNILFQNYYKALRDYVVTLNVKNVIFTGHVPDEDLEAYYSVSDIFLCMSEHEGFCIPLLEAMKRKLPIIAYSSTAIPDTLGGAGVLVDTKEEKKVCQIIDRLICDLQYREDVIKLQVERVGLFGLENYKNELMKIIEEVIKKDVAEYSFEKRNLSIPYLCEKKSVQDVFDLADDIYQEKEKVIIYGIGKIGKRLFANCKKSRKDFLKKTIICDNAYKEDTYYGIPVLKHQECVLKYPDAMYIVTVQRSCVSIIADLIKDNIEAKNIKFYNASSNKIV